MKVAFLGPLTSFSHDAALKAFPNTELLEVHSIHDVFSAVRKGRADAGVVPIENSTEGSVNTTLDLLLSNELVISKEVFVNIAHSFIANAGVEKVNKIYSHPQAFAQCQNWLRKRYPKAELVGASSTASAAVHAASNGNSAAIASEKTAKRFGLRVVQQNIQDLSFNKTRFIVIGKKAAKAARTNKTTMFFAVKDRPGALFDCLKGFKDLNVNLTRLESRPSRKSAWDYVFFVEFVGDVSEPRIKDALAELKKHANFVKVLGSYPRIGD
jgi:chorismate mutase/prephenate dehydratase